MTWKGKTTGRALSMGAGIALGLGAAMAITVVGAALVAWLAITERMGESGIGYGAMVILVLSAAIGGFIACGTIRRRKLMVCCICAVGYYLLLLSMTALLFGGQYDGMGTTALMVMLGGGIALIPVVTGKGNGARRHKIKGYR